MKKKNPLSDFFLITDFVALKLNYVLMYCGIRIYFLNMWLKEFSLSLWRRDIWLKLINFNYVSATYVNSVPNNRFSWILSPIYVKNMYKLSKQI